MCSINLTFPKRLFLKRCCRSLISFVRNEQTVSENSSLNVPKFNPFDVRRLRRRYEDEKPTIASRMCVTVLGNGAIGQPSCLCLFTELKCYMFNCGEGSMRIAKEQDILFVNAKHVFITENSWKNLSGLPDIYLTHHAYRAKKITLHGPPNTEEFLTIVESTKSVKLKKVDFDISPFVDDNIEIESVPLYGGAKDKFIYDKNPKQYGTTKCIVSYICKVRPKAGEFSTEKCIKYGVPLGPPLLQLKNGEDITLPMGELVRSQDVHDSYIPGCKFLVVDCPYNRFIKPLIYNEKFRPNKISDISAVFHFTPPHIINTYEYKNWMHSFPSTTLHIILNSDNNPMSSEVIHEIQHVLHMMHPRIFPLLKEKPTFPPFEMKENFIQADSRLQLHIRPNFHLDRANIVELKPKSYIQTALEVPGFQEELSKLQNIINHENNTILKDKPLGNYPEIVFLGTSSSTASAYRNATCILVHLSPDNSIILDCGEGSYMQLVRYYGTENIDAILRNISAIFISHHHTDHYMGVFQLVKARKKAFPYGDYIPIAIITNSIVERLINRFHRIYDPIKEDIKIFLSQALREQVNHREELGHFLKDVEVQPVPVIHCEEAHGAVLHGAGWKIVYSGDACPSQTLINAGQCCDLLIHEASMEDNLNSEASIRNHSTPCQVVYIAEKMNARYTIMTHFSKRYLAVPVFAQSNEIGCAFDNMTVRLCDLPLVPLFIPALKVLFLKQLEEYTEKSSSAVSFEKVFLRNLQKSSVVT